MRSLPSLTVYTAAALLLPVLSAQASSLLIADSFNTVNPANDGNFDNSDQTGRRTGLLASNVQLRSSRVQHTIASSSRLAMGKHATSGSARIRFHDANNLGNWWNFASGAGGAAILGDGGISVTFDWTAANNTSGDWVSFNAGINPQPAGEPGTRVNDPGTDFGILLRNTGAIQIFDNGAVTTPATTFNVASLTRQVRLDYTFGAFADGSQVSFSAWVDGVNIVSGQPFNWEGNGGVINLELGNLAAGTLIDNFAIATIPEPSAAGLAGLAGFGLLSRRRKR